jgi:hypothetical protein
MKTPAYIFAMSRKYTLNHEQINRSVYEDEVGTLRKFTSLQVRTGYAAYLREMEKKK